MVVARVRHNRLARGSFGGDALALALDEDTEVGDFVEAAAELCAERAEVRQLEYGGVEEGGEVEGHFRGAERATSGPLDAGGDDVVRLHEARAPGPADDGAHDGDVGGPVLRVPLAQQGLQPDLALGVEAVAAEDAVVWGQGEEGGGRLGGEAALLLGARDGAEEAQCVGEHHAVGQLSSGVQRRELPPVLGNGSEGHHHVDVHAQPLVHVGH